MKMIKYPIDTKNDQLTYSYWIGRMIGLIETSLSTPPDQLEAAKDAFSAGFADLFPTGHTNLNSIEAKDLVTNTDESEESQIWMTYSKLLKLWMDLQEEAIPGLEETNLVQKQEFVNTLQLAKHNLEKLHKD